VVAVPLGMAIESGGWRRWPAVAGGAARDDTEALEAIRRFH
jgi:hypothetical protein